MSRSREAWGAKKFREKIIEFQVAVKEIFPNKLQCFYSFKKEPGKPSIYGNVHLGHNRALVLGPQAQALISSPTIAHPTMY